MSARRPTEAKLESIAASCAGCPWSSRAANAQATAARHHDTTGHVVNVDVRRTIRYGDPQAGQPSLLDAIRESATP